MIDIENYRMDIVIEILIKYHYRFQMLPENRIYLIDKKLHLELPKEISNAVLVEFDQSWNPNHSAAFVSIFSTYAIWEGYNFDPRFSDGPDGRLLAGWAIIDEE
ncbi:MAG: hypothetical protein JRH09_19725 [Deltaproteobacteria bacterium]|nr:hypothetical protein [Deltaproteobacteria bacterium]